MISKGRLKLYRSLGRREARVAEGIYLVEGARLVTEAVRSGAGIVELVVTDSFAASPAGSALLELATGVPVERIAERDLPRIADTRTPQGVLAVLRRTPPPEGALAGEGLFLALDGVADPGNAGTLVRAADAFGARAVVAGPGSADFENPKTLRAAMGSTFHLPVVAVEDLAGTLAGMREGGVVVLAAVLDGEDLYTLGTLGARVAVVLGNEAHGVSEEVRATADRLVTVPCPGRAESLNVAMAGAILLSRLAGGGA